MNKISSLTHSFFTPDLLDAECQDISGAVIDEIEGHTLSIWEIYPFSEIETRLLCGGYDE